MTGKIRIRALLVGLIFGILFCALTPFADTYLHTTPLAGGHFPLAAFFLFFFALLSLAGISRLTGKAPFLHGMELLVAWALMVVVSGIGFTGLIRTFFFNITSPARLADSTNNWGQSLQPLLPEALYPRDPQLLDGLYSGLPQAQDMGLFAVLSHIPWAAWLPVLGSWLFFIFLVYLTLFCLANLFTGQWVVNERINFPLLQTPKLLAEAYDKHELLSFLANPFLLSGLALPLLLHTFGGLSAHYPSVPALPTEILLGSYFPTNGVLSGFQKVKIFLYPAFIGFAFITTRQISLSFWLFFLLAGLFSGLLSSSGLQIPDSALGTLFGPTIAKPEEIQILGGATVFFLFILWLSREYLQEVIADCLRPRSTGPQAGWIPARVSLWGTLLGLIALCLWSTAWGMGLGTAILLYFAFFAAMLVVGKIICQGGIPYCTFNAAPSDGILSLLGSKPLGTMGLVLGMSLQKMLFVDVRESLFPSLLHAGKISDPIPQRGWFGFCIVMGLMLAVTASFISMLYLCYRYGLQELDMDWASRTSQAVYYNAQRLLEVEQQPNHWGLTFFALGAAVMLVLVFCYYLFPWWPIHPIGYLMAYSSSMDILWFSFFIGWLCNSVCLRYGGTRLYRKLRMFFIGLIIGDYCMGVLWALISLKTGVSYLVLPS